MAATRKKSRETVARNLRELMKSRPELRSGREIARLAGVAPDTVNNLFKETGPSLSLENLDNIARAVNLPAWLLLTPDIDVFRAKTKDLHTLLDRYAQIDDQGQQLILAIAERAMPYQPPKKPADSE